MRTAILWNAFICVIAFDPSAVVAGSLEDSLTEGVFALREKKYDVALEAFNAAVESDPQCHAAFYGRGFARKELGDYPKAIEDLSESIRLSPDDDTPFVARAEAHQRSGDLDRAMADIDQAIHLAGDEATAYMYLFRGALHAWNKDHDLGIADATTAIRRVPLSKWG